jgi:hypothetical protein
MSTCTRDCAGLGVVIVLEPLHDRENFQIMVPLFITPTPTNEVVYKMNKAALSVGPVVGVKRASTGFCGVSLCLVIDGDIEEDTLPTIIEMFLDELEDSFTRTPIDTQSAVAVYALPSNREVR